jgi:NAD(P)-dependent dehydrogenase (short-subunit alcohol dehydrogenase family)
MPSHDLDALSALLEQAAALPPDARGAPTASICCTSIASTPTSLAVTLDVTSPADAEAAVRAGVDRFGRIDVLVNNAASFYSGYFEELTPEQIGQQLAASLIGPMNVTRAVLPVMRKQRSGHVISISSSAGLSGFEFGLLTPRRNSVSRVGWSR